MSNLDSISGSNAVKYSNDLSNPDGSSSTMSGTGYDNNKSSGYGNNTSSGYGNNTSSEYGNSASSAYDNNTTSSGYDSTGTSAFGNSDQFTNSHHDHSKGIAPVHHQTTSNNYDNYDNSNNSNSNSNSNFDSMNNNSNNNNYTTSNTTSTYPNASQTGPINPSTESEPLNSHTRPSIAAGDNNTTNTPVIAGDTTIRRSSVAQNAPGTAGEIGENVMGALGYGGSRVERPREDQGLGEKIVNFLGA